jgi:glycosyltransferase involved in cell wall biosynthesis
MLFSAIVPCYNEEENVADIYREITNNDEFFKSRDLELEIIYIDDGSRDGTVKEVKKLIESDKRVHLVSFSRNFGKEAGIYAGLEASKGDYVAIMDADLQDPPSLLPEMFKAVMDEGFDSAATRRVTRKGEPPIRSFFARLFYKLMNKFSNTELMDGARDYRLMTRRMVEAVLNMKEYNRFSKGIFGWVGFNTKWIEFENVERTKGETKWSFWGLFKYSLEGIMAFSTAPLALASVMGIFFTFVAFVAIIFIIIRTLVFGDPTNGWPSMVCIIIFVSGIQLFCVGVVGQYISKVYLEVKERPIYIVKEKI